jgi:hypothetical protein
MKKSMLEGNLQILLRSQQVAKGDKVPRKQKALSAFFDTKCCHELYPDTVECKRTGVWVKEDSGNQRANKGMYRVWAIYSREVNTDEETPDEETSEEVVS